MRNRRGQAAMEFLMTYGWAILAAIIVVGVLWYIIGNPANLAGDRFMMSNPLPNNAMALTAGAVANSVLIEIRNGAGETITVTEVVVSNCGTTGAITTSVADGGLQQFSLDCTPDLVSGSRFKGDVTIRYTKSGSTVVQIASGTISGKVP